MQNLFIMVIGTQKKDLNLQKIIDQKRNKVNGSVKLKLYKGNITNSI